MLSKSAKLNLESHKLQVTDFEGRKNRPVLHRKELLLPPEHSHFEKFAALTSHAEALGSLEALANIRMLAASRRGDAEWARQVDADTRSLREAVRQSCDRWAG